VPDIHREDSGLCTAGAVGPDYVLVLVAGFGTAADIGLRSATDQSRGSVAEAKAGREFQVD